MNARILTLATGIALVVSPLGAIGDEGKGKGQIPSALAKALKHESPEVRQTAAEALGRMGPNAKEAVPALMEALKDEVTQVRVSSAYALGQIGADAKEAVPPLVTALDDEATQVREAAAYALGGIGGEEVVPGLIGAIRDGRDAAVRSIAVDALGQIRAAAKEAIPVLIEALRDGDPTVRAAVARALGRVASQVPEAQGVISQLAKAVTDEDPLVRQSAAYGLQQVGARAKEAVPILVEALEHKDPEIRRTAAYALGQIGPDAKEAVPILAEALKHKDPEIRRTAADALGQIGPDAREAVPALMATLEDKTPEVRQSAVYALGAIGDQRPVSELIRLLMSDSDPTVREFAGAALDHIGSYPKEAILQLAKAVTDEDEGVRQSVVYALRQMGADAKDAVPALAKALKHEDPEVRSDAADVLGAIGPDAKEAVPALTAALEDKAPDVRWAAASALMQIGPNAKEAVPALVEALKNGEPPELREAAAYALAEIAVDDEVADSVGRALSERLRVEDNPRVTSAVGGVLQLFVPALSEKTIDFGLESIEQSLGQPAATDVRQQLTSTRDVLHKAQQERESQKKLKSELEASLKAENQALEAANEAQDALRALRDAPSWVESLTKDWRTRVLLSLAIYLVAVLAAWLVILAVEPLWILNVNEWLARSPVLSPLRYVSLVSVFGYHGRVLDAWVAAHVENAEEDFLKLPTVDHRAVHVPMPVVLDGRTVPELTPDLLRPALSAKPARLLVLGDGGVGKTSLACQIAKWGMAEDEFRRPCRHRMIPVLVEQELDGPFEKTIYDELKKLTGDQEIPRGLFDQLAAKQRILVILDRFSETSEASRAKVFAGDTTSSVGILVVTSRIDEKLDTDTRTVLEPLHVMGNRLASFIEGYLTSRDERGLFDDVEFFDACRRLSLMAGERPITAMCAKVYADQLVSAKHEGKDALIGGPENIPELMLRYLRHVNHEEAKDKIDFETILRHSKAVAWVCLEETLRPGRASRQTTLEALDGDDPQAILEYLEGPLPLIQSVGPEGNAIRFFLDPLAEYLAGLHLVDAYADSKVEWERFLGRAAEQPEPEKIRGFLLAVRDCCLGTRADVPSFVAERLAELAGFDAKKARREQLAQRIRANVANLGLPEAEDRLAAAQRLGYVGREAKPAIPALVKALADKDWRIRATAAVALGKICAAENASDFLEAEIPVSPLQERLGDEHPAVRAYAAEALGQIGQRAEGAVEQIAEALGDKQDAAVREAAAVALGRIGAGAARAVPALIGALDDEDWNVRREAGEALANVGPDSVDPLMQALGDTDEVVRWRAAEALARIGPPAAKAAPALTGALADEDWGVRQNAALALGRIGPAAKEAVSRLEKALEDQEKSVARAARAALDAIQPQIASEVGPSLQE